MANANGNNVSEYPAKVRAVDSASGRVEIEVGGEGEGYRMTIPANALDFEVEPGKELVVEGIGSGEEMRIIRFRRPR